VRKCRVICDAKAIDLGAQACQDGEPDALKINLTVCVRLDPGKDHILMLVQIYCKRQHGKDDYDNPEDNAGNNGYLFHSGTSYMQQLLHEPNPGGFIACTLRRDNGGDKRGGCRQNHKSELGKTLASLQDDI
jgi:hypothetical protein